MAAEQLAEEKKQTALMTEMRDNTKKQQRRRKRRKKRIEEESDDGDNESADTPKRSRSPDPPSREDLLRIRQAKEELRKAKAQLRTPRKGRNDDVIPDDRRYERNPHVSQKYNVGSTGERESTRQRNLREKAEREELVS